MAAKVEVKKDKAGEFRWHVKAANGEIVASGEGFTSKADANRGFAEAAVVMADVAAGRVDAERPMTPEEYAAEHKRLSAELDERNAATAQRELEEHAARQEAAQT